MTYDLKRELLYKLELVCEDQIAGKAVSIEEIIETLREKTELTHEEAEKFFKTYYDRVRKDMVVCDG